LAKKHFFVDIEPQCVDLTMQNAVAIINGIKQQNSSPLSVIQHNKLDLQNYFNFNGTLF
jgi:hypothetical protein